MSNKTNVSTATVRAWARENIASMPVEARACLGSKARGRLHPSVITAFEKAHRGKAYTERVAERRTVTVPVVTLTKAGLKTTVRKTIDTASAREMLGRPTTQRGRLPLGVLSEALSAVEAESFAGSFA